MTTKLEGGGVKALVIQPLRKALFCGFPKKDVAWKFYWLFNTKNLWKGMPFLFFIYSIDD